MAVDAPYGNWPAVFAIRTAKRPCRDRLYGPSKGHKGCWPVAHRDLRANPRANGKPANSETGGTAPGKSGDCGMLGGKGKAGRTPLTSAPGCARHGTIRLRPAFHHRPLPRRHPGQPNFLRHPHLTGNLPVLIIISLHIVIYYDMHRAADS